MKKTNKVVVSIVAIVIVAALLIGYFLLKDRNSASNGEGAYVEKVSVITGGGMIYADRYSGVVESQETLEIKKDSERPVEELYVEIGETVIIGSPLFKYDVTEAQNSIASTQLEIEGINNDIAALNAEISELVSDRNRASADEKLDYTTQIQSKQMQIRQDDIELQQKKQDLQKYQKEIDNAVVTSSISGVVKTISENGYDNFGNELPYISITQTGEYHVKGKVDENSIGVIVPGMNIIIRSRIDESATWTGSVSHIDTEPVTDNNNNYYGGES
ncbi:MAG: efflux RND transporter periplasmic adaptor subunit, partial [Solobacterium sp.]|nr:efflux RND transporter periplasmic adaptor subunit [Solobacterium sp.]